MSMPSRKRAVIPAVSYVLSDFNVWQCVQLVEYIVSVASHVFPVSSPVPKLWTVRHWFIVGDITVFRHASKQ
jgi:hypothetical protein